MPSRRRRQRSFEDGLRLSSEVGRARRWTTGFTGWTWAVVVTQAASGYAIGALLKHVDAIGQVFADVVAMMISALVAFALFDLAANWQYAVALLVCSMSLGVSARPRRNSTVAAAAEYPRRGRGGAATRFAASTEYPTS